MKKPAKWSPALPFAFSLKQPRKGHRRFGSVQLTLTGIRNRMAGHPVLDIRVGPQAPEGDAKHGLPQLEVVAAIADQPAAIETRVASQGQCLEPYNMKKHKQQSNISSTTTGSGVVVPLSQCSCLLHKGRRSLKGCNPSGMQIMASCTPRLAKPSKQTPNLPMLVPSVKHFPLLPSSSSPLKWNRPPGSPG